VRGDQGALRAVVERLRVENARLQRVLELRPGEALPLGPTQTAIFDAAPGPVDNASSSETTVSGRCLGGIRTHGPSLPNHGNPVRLVYRSHFLGSASGRHPQNRPDPRGPGNFREKSVTRGRSRTRVPVAMTHTRHRNVPHLITTRTTSE
jgi:hypothetical protein